MTIIPNEDEFFYFRQIGDVIVSKATGRIITKLDENTFVEENAENGLLVVKNADKSVVCDYRGELLSHFENGASFKEFSRERVETRHYVVKTEEGEKRCHIPCIRRDDFVIEYDEKSQQYAFSTTNGKQFAIGKDFELRKIDEGLFIAIQDEKERWTVYNAKGIVEPQLKDVVCVRVYEENKFHVRRTPDSCMEPALTKQQTRRRNVKWGTLIGLLSLAVVVGGKGCQAYMDELRAIRQQEATYLGVSDSVLLFDTDGNHATIELGVSLTDKKDKVRVLGSLFQQEGQCRKVAQWCDMTGLATAYFEKVNSN